MSLFLEEGMYIPYLTNNMSQWGEHGWGMGPGMMGWGSGWGWFGMIIMAAFWIAVIVGIVFLIRWLAIAAASGSRKTSAEDSSLEILKKRYARGDIGKEEFEAKKKDLEV